jgi:hypothetical protein
VLQGESAWVHPIDEEYRQKFAAAQAQAAVATEAAAKAQAAQAEQAAQAATAAAAAAAAAEPAEAPVQVTVAQILTEPTFRSALLRVATLLGIEHQDNDKYLAIAAECLSRNQTEPEGWQTGIDPGSGHQYWWNDTTVRKRPMG